MATTTKGIPVFLTGRALRSLRDSGYSLPAALAEVIDNALEANANHIAVVLDEGSGGKDKRHIHRIVVVDDGEGMDGNEEGVLHHYPQIGFSTRYMNTTTIGKYGVGAKLAALNFGTRIEVWSRTSPADPWLYVSFDLDEAFADEEAGQTPVLWPPVDKPVPGDLLELLPAGSGTMVVWSNVDRLEEGRWAENADRLRVDVEKELSRIFRYYIDGGIHIEVNGNDLYPHDPLYLLEETWVDAELGSFYESKRGKEFAARLGFKWPKDKVPAHFAPEVFTEKEEIHIGGSTAYLTVTLAPREVLRKRQMGGDDLAKKLRVPENQGAISFVRLEREISYTNVARILPMGVLDVDRFIGIEVAFNPELDDYFGVRNVKKGAEPHDVLRTEIRKRLARYIPQARARIDEIWGKATQEAEDLHGEHAGIVEAAADVNKTLPKPRVLAPVDPEEVERELEDLAKDVFGDHKGKKKARDEYKEKMRDLPFVIESVDFPGTNFIETRHLGDQVIIRLNTRHRFYREMWAPLKDLSEATPGSLTSDEGTKAARRSVEALTLMVIAYAKAEGMHPTPHDAYDELRNDWGKFLSTLLQKIKNVI